MNNRFSQRNGNTPNAKALQIASMDADLRNGLWNIVIMEVLDKLPNHSQFHGHDSPFELFCKILWHHFYKGTIDDLPRNPEEVIRNKFFACDWFVVYDFLEFIVLLDTNSLPIHTYNFQEGCNRILARECSGYRFIDYLISPISNEHEIEEIEEALDETAQFTAFRGANIHLKDALVKLSDRTNPDYRNSIKESISAIESIAKVIAETSENSLGPALDILKRKANLHGALVSGFKSLYGYTSDAGGMRHCLMDAPNCDFHDAKYMLVSCSAFVNYLISKASKAGIQFK